MNGLPVTESGEATDEYMRRAEKHRPLTVDGLRSEAQRLLREGFSDHGIASALRMNVAAVRRLIGECGDCQ